MANSGEVSHIDIISIGSSLYVIRTEDDVADIDFVKVCQRTSHNVDIDFAIGCDLRGRGDNELELGSTVDFDSIQEGPGDRGGGISQGGS